MKTVDLIPLILLELNECDKYGFELTKNIENKSNGQIIIKQPTLYTLLKKLEKSKFISSYWQDSEIGGKRHYYKLTENGKMQVSTLPDYNFLLKNALSEDLEVEEQSASDLSTPTSNKEKNSIMDDLLNQHSEPSVTILPTNEVFANNNIDNSTEMEINLSNVDMLKKENMSQDEQFAENTNVMKFTEKTVSTPPETKTEIKPNSSHTDSILDVEFSIPKTEKTIEYVDYIDLKNNNSYKYAKTISKKLLFQSLATSGSLIILLILCGIGSIFSARSTLYYLFFISSVVVVIFYPIIVLSNMEKLRIKYQQKPYETKTKQKMFIAFSLLFVTILLCVVVNIRIGNNTFALMFGLGNFENLYAPIILASVFFLDTLFNYIFLVKKK